MCLAGLGYRRLRLLRACHIAREAQPADIICERPSAAAVDIEHRNLGPRLGQHARGLGAKARAGAGDDGRRAGNLHDVPVLYPSETIEAYQIGWTIATRCRCTYMDLRDVRHRGTQGREERPGWQAGTASP